MEKTTGQKRVKLSRFFAGDTQLDAGICPKSYAAKEGTIVSDDSDIVKVEKGNRDTKKNSSGGRSKYFGESVVNAAIGETREGDKENPSVNGHPFGEMESLTERDESKKHSMPEICFSRGQLYIKEQAETKKPQTHREGSSRRNSSKKQSLDRTSQCCCTRVEPEHISQEFTEAKLKPNNDTTGISVNLVSKCDKLLKETLVNLNDPTWKPPCSPHNLIEEGLANNPWGLLVATIFLNKTSCSSASPLLSRFLEENPHPSSVLAKSPASLEKYFETLGLQTTRAIRVWRMTHDFVHKEWKSVRELYGIGRYGEEAFKMFCLGDMSFEPNDRFLKIYRAWYLMKQKDVCRSNEQQEGMKDIVGTDGERRKTYPECNREEGNDNS